MAIKKIEIKKKSFLFIFRFKFLLYLFFVFISTGHLHQQIHLLRVRVQRRLDRTQLRHQTQLLPVLHVRQRRLVHLHKPGRSMPVRARLDRLQL